MEDNSDNIDNNLPKSINNNNSPIELANSDNIISNKEDEIDSKTSYKVLYADVGYIEVNNKDWENEKLVLVPFKNINNNITGSLNVNLI